MSRKLEDLNRQELWALLMRCMKDGFAQSCEGGNAECDQHEREPKEQDLEVFLKEEGLE